MLVKSFHASIAQNIGASPVATMFDPEDEPLGPMFGSPTSQFDWSTATLSSYKAKPGLFGRMKQSLRNKSLLPKFLCGQFFQCNKRNILCKLKFATLLFVN